MSHVAVRLLADRLAHDSEGINAVSAHVPRFDGDEVPADVTVYDELRHPWVARRQVPRADSEIDFPCAIVFMQTLDDPAGVAAEGVEGAYGTATVTLCIQVVMQDPETDGLVRSGAYIMRAIRGVLKRFDHPSLTTDPEREACGTRLLPSLGMRSGQVTAFVDDTTYTPGCVFATYPILETVPI